MEYHIYVFKSTFHSLKILREKIGYWRKFLPKNKKNLFFGSKMGVDIYTGKYGTAVLNRFW